MASNAPPLRITHAHDVRRLRQCPLCGQLGDSADMLAQSGGSANAKHVHGRCWLAEYGLVSLLQQPPEQLLRLRLSDIGVDAMRAVLDHQATAKAAA